jgi:glutaminyl-peptide cyclotransferase
MKYTQQNYLLILLIFVILACSSENSHKAKTAGDNDSTKFPVIKYLSIDAPLNSATYTMGDEVPIKIKYNPAVSKIDSLQLFINDRYFTSGDSDKLELSWDSKGATIGRNRIRVNAYKAGKNTESGTTSIILLSDIEPKTLHFKVINTYPHDPQAYTQGLVFENGIFYESTGQYAQSSLRKVDVKTGEVRQSVNLSSDIFGEGLASYGDNLIQITWKSQVAFIYDKKTFNQINKFNYQREGWGITYDGKRLIMSDGSEILTFYDTEYFAEQGHIEVCDDKEPIKWLNELEYIKGDIYANIYQETRIAVIDPVFGKVKAYLELASLVPEKLKNDNDRVLNGIAWNPANGHLFVTGKDWPKLYEIEVY